MIRTLPQNQDQFTIRADQDLAKFGRTFFRLTRTMYDNRTDCEPSGHRRPRCSCRTRPTGRSSTRGRSSSNLVNNFRFGRVDARADQQGIPCPQSDVDSLQLTGVFTDIPDDQRECPSVGIQSFAGRRRRRQRLFTPATSRCGTSATPPRGFAARTRSTSGSTTGAGGCSAISPRGFWAATPSDWRDLGFTGNPVADFLLGYYSNVGLFQPAAFSVPGQAGNPREFNFKYFAPYVQDDWKVNSRLTLNLGLRWDYRNVPYETSNRMGWRNLDYAPGGLLVADETLVSGGITDGAYYQFAGRRSPENPDRFKVFAPRVGFAWRPFDDERTVLRGGYGVFFDSAEGREIDGAADIYPYVSRGNYQQSLGQPAPLKTTDTLFPSFEQPGVATPAANTFLAVNQSPEPKNPYVQQWSLGVQRQLTGATTLELNYIGNKGTNLLMRQNIAQALPLRSRQSSVRSRRGGRFPISSSTSTATGAGDRTTTPSTPSSSIVVAARCSRSPTPGRRAPIRNRRPPASAPAGSTAGRVSSTITIPSAITGCRTSTSIIAWSAASSTTCRSATARSSPAMPRASRTRSSAAGR